MEHRSAAGPMVDGFTRQVPGPDFGPTLHAARTRRGYSLRALAAAAGISLGHTHLMEQGKRCPSVPVAEALVAALALEPSDAAIIRADAVTGHGRDFTPPYIPARRRLPHERPDSRTTP